MTQSFNIPSVIIAGAGVRETLADQVIKMGAKRALFITDSFIYEKGWIVEMSQSLNERGIATAVYKGVQPDPTTEIVQQGLQHLLEHNADVIIACGGGSTIDAAKAISVLKTNPEPLSQYMGYHKIKRKGVPIIAIPTTAGTGSEVTKVTVITNTVNKVKMMILDSHLLPSVALIDFELSMSMPQTLTAYVGMDTLTHGIEAYVSKKANYLTDPIALSCIHLVSKHLMTAWNEPDNRKAREGMAIAACQGGMAFANSSVCLVHGMSRSLGVEFHLPHGLSNAVLLETITRYSLSGAMQRFATISKILGFAKEMDSEEASVDALIEGIQFLNNQLQIPQLRDCLKIERKDFESVLEKMAIDALASGSPQNNPVIPNVKQIMDLYKQAW